MCLYSVKVAAHDSLVHIPVHVGLPRDFQRNERERLLVTERKVHDVDGAGRSRPLSLFLLRLWQHWTLVYATDGSQPLIVHRQDNDRAVVVLDTQQTIVMVRFHLDGRHVHQSLDRQFTIGARR